MNLRVLGMFPAGCQSGAAGLEMFPRDLRIRERALRIDPRAVRIDPQALRICPRRSRMYPEALRINPQAARIDPQAPRIHPRRLRMYPGRVRTYPEARREHLQAFLLDPTCDRPPAGTVAILRRVMDFRSRLLATLRRVAPLFEDPGVMVVGLERREEAPATTRSSSGLSRSRWRGTSGSAHRSFGTSSA